MSLELSSDHLVTPGLPSKPAGWTAFGFLSGVPLLLAGVQVFDGLNLSPYAIDPFIVFAGSLVVLTGVVLLNASQRRDAVKLSWQVVGLALLGMVVLLYLNQTNRGVVICSSIGVMLGTIVQIVMKAGWRPIEKALAPVGGVPDAYVDLQRYESLSLEDNPPMDWDADPADDDEHTVETIEPEVPAALASGNTVQATSDSAAASYQQIIVPEATAEPNVEPSQVAVPVAEAIAVETQNPNQGLESSEGVELPPMTLPKLEIPAIARTSSEPMAASGEAGDTTVQDAVPTVPQAPVPTIRYTDMVGQSADGEIGYDPSSFRFPNQQEFRSEDAPEAPKKRTLFSVFNKSASDGPQSEAHEPSSANVPDAVVMTNDATKRLLERFNQKQSAFASETTPSEIPSSEVIMSQAIEDNEPVQVVAPFLQPAALREESEPVAEPAGSSHSEDDELAALREALRRARKY